MSVIETSLHMSYQEKTWGLREAIRELISNAIDGETRFASTGVGRMSLDYDIAGKFLTVRNEGVTVPAKALLMGSSESRGDERLIGEFGEGLPMALLVLSRMRYAVEIDNGAERWVPSIERSAKFEGEPVLMIKTRPRRLKTSDVSFEVRVHGIGADDWAIIRGLFLRLDPTFDPNQAIGRYGSGSDERVLLQPQYTGKVYNKGVLICEREDLMFGYDLRGQLNRDRSIVDAENLRGQLSSLLSTAVSNNHDRFLPILRASMFADDGSASLELSEGYNDLVWNDAVSKMVLEEFVRRYGENAIPVEDEEEEKRAIGVGRRPVRANATIKRMVTRTTGSLSDLERKASQAIIRSWNTDELGTHERYNFETVLALAQAVHVGEFTMQAVNFAGSTEFTVDRETSTILVSRAVLMNFAPFVKLMARAVCSLSVREELTVESFLASVVDKLLHGDSRLAILLLAKEGIRVGGSA